MNFGRLNRQDATKLEDPFVENEVFNALLDLNRDKALGSNGFSMTFWKFSWDFVKEEVMGFFSNLHMQGRFVKSINSTFLVLVPKNEGV